MVTGVDGYTTKTEIYVTRLSNKHSLKPKQRRKRVSPAVDENTLRSHGGFKDGSCQSNEGEGLPTPNINNKPDVSPQPGCMFTYPTRILLR